MVMANTSGINLNENSFISGEYRIYHLQGCTHQQNDDYSLLQATF